MMHRKAHGTNLGYAHVCVANRLLQGGTTVNALWHSARV